MSKTDNIKGYENKTINWYPGHMAKAKRMMQESIKLIDVVVEILDARIPAGSKNPDIDDLAKGKYRVLLLNKSDMADESKTAAWKKYYENKGFFVSIVNSKTGAGVKATTEVIQKACQEKIERDRKKGILQRPLRAMIAGIPNSGKSTFINSFAGKACTKTGNKPGVTIGKQWIRINKNVELLDTPGILWPKFEDQRTGLHIAFIGSINDDILYPEDMALELIKILVKDYPAVLKERYDIEMTMGTAPLVTADGDGSDASNECSNDEAVKILEAIGQKRGCLKKGAEIDLEKASKLLIDDFRSLKLGRITLEVPPED
ncbi:MAG: ribosome biogenesis GTPase YlqF [Lachnospiraceae bacterium]|nr:ribosome biogenesis GTPase YlqF [Lachnospiraceae bacterium]